MVPSGQYIYNSRSDKNGLGGDSIMDTFPGDIGFGP
jgi:hypothetical protein